MRFMAGFADEVVKLASISDEMASPDLARSQKAEDAPDSKPGEHYKPKIGSGSLGPSLGGPLLADPTKYPFNRLAP